MAQSEIELDQGLHNTNAVDTTIHKTCSSAYSFRPADVNFVVSPEHWAPVFTLGYTSC